MDGDGPGNNIMKVLVLYDYPAAPGGLATQGDLLYKGLLEIGVEAFPANGVSPQEKEIRSLRCRGLKPSIPPDELIGKCLIAFTICSLDVSKVSMFGKGSISLSMSSSGCFPFNFS